MSNIAETPAGKVLIWKTFPGAFWIANTMEIFERMGWYGFYAVSSLYLTSAVAEGGLLSGVTYQHFGPKGIDKPGIMWLIFAGLALISAILPGVYNRWVQSHPAR